MIQDVFYLSLQERNIKKKKQVDKTTLQLQFKGNGKKYKIKTIPNSEVYTRESENYLLGLQDLLSLKSYLEEEDILKPALAI